MEYTLFVGCNIPARVPQYELSARAVLWKLGLNTHVLPEFGCCGYPMRNADFKTYLHFAARNLALAEKQGRPLMTLCKCCFGSLKKAAHLLGEDAALLAEINTNLAKEDLNFSGQLEVTHMLKVLHEKVGAAKIKKALKHKFEKLNIATHYGCHALRPSSVMQFDDPTAPVVFDDLVNATGAKSVAWASKLECCGAPLTGINDSLSMDLTAKKLEDGKKAGAHYLCVACPWCQLQFDNVQKTMAAEGKMDRTLGSILYPQLLGLALGLNVKKLGIDDNVIPINSISAFLEESAGD
jgi:heterodisulfide reductase subunit B2